MRPNLSEAARVRFVRGSVIALGLIVLAIVAMAYIGAGFVARRQA
jgi:hypothetical protein